MATREDSITGRVRQFAAASGAFRLKIMRETLDLPKAQAKTAVDSLVTSRELKRLAHGVYAFVEAQQAPPAEREAKIWAAMRMSPRFTCGEIAQLAGTSPSYLYKRMREYRAAGYVSEAGCRWNAERTGKEKIWRLTVQAQKMVDCPVVTPWEPDPLVEAAVRLNQLVCTGAARHVADRRAEALGLCGTVETLLKELEDDHAES
ncbi:hypothetical protein, partial [Desulfovibrio inopinatus]|uniref:hypothetical protein n=1 Tax=Desulfovibrio inopinatus TaxID=102109 RepID=UPI000483DE21